MWIVDRVSTKHEQSALALAWQKYFYNSNQLVICPPLQAILINFVAKISKFYNYMIYLASQFR